MQKFYRKTTYKDSAKTCRILFAHKLGNIYFNNILICSPIINNVGNFFTNLIPFCSPKHKHLNRTTTQQQNSKITSRISRNKLKATSHRKGNEFTPKLRLDRLNLIFLIILLQITFKTSNLFIFDK